MKVIGLVVLVIALLAFAASAQLCTSETCLEGPVFAYFDSEDCSGAPRFEQFSLVDTCTVGHQTFVAEDRVTSTWFTSPVCDENEGLWSETFVFGICSKMGVITRDGQSSDARRHTVMRRQTTAEVPQSRMILANVNATFVAPQTTFVLDSGVTPYNDAWHECYSTNNCTLDDGSSALYYENYYGEYNCSSLRYSEMMPGYQPERCFNYANMAYVLASCVTAESYQNGFFNTPDCSGVPFFYEYGHSICGSRSYYEGHCSGPLRPSYGSIQPSTPIPTGNAASFTLSSIAILLAMLAILAL